MKTTIHRCKNCNFRKMLYRRYAFIFGKCKIYYCAHHERIIRTGDGCDCRHKKEVQYDLSGTRFDEAVDDIEFLKKILL